MPNIKKKSFVGEVFLGRVSIHHCASNRGITYQR